MDPLSAETGEGRGKGEGKCKFPERIGDTNISRGGVAVEAEWQPSACSSPQGIAGTCPTWHQASIPEHRKYVRSACISDTLHTLLPRFSIPISTSVALPHRDCQRPVGRICSSYETRTRGTRHATSSRSHVVPSPNRQILHQRTKLKESGGTTPNPACTSNSIPPGRGSTIVM